MGKRAARFFKRLAALKKANHERLVGRGGFTSVGEPRNQCATCSKPTRLEKNPKGQWSLYCPACGAFSTAAA